MGTSRPMPLIPMRHQPVSEAQSAHHLWPIGILCPDTSQPLNKHMVDGLILSALSDHVALKSGTGHCHCPAPCLALGGQADDTLCEAALST